MFTQRRSSMLIIALVLSSVSAHAQWAVVDAPAIVQLVQQVRTLEQAVQTARDQLNQARQALGTTTGTRGMERLGFGVARNYLPSDGAELAALQTGSTAFPLLSADLRRAAAVNAVLTPQQLAAFAPAERQRVIDARQGGALQQVLSQTALAATSGHFTVLQNLIGAIPSAGDQKAILDLQARISTELGMLQNEQTKLQVLSQVALAQDAVRRQQERETLVAAHGRFESRFQPAP